MITTKVIVEFSAVFMIISNKLKAFYPLNQVLIKINQMHANNIKL